MLVSVRRASAWLALVRAPIPEDIETYNTTLVDCTPYREEGLENGQFQFKQNYVAFDGDPGHDTDLNGQYVC